MPATLPPATSTSLGHFSDTSRSVNPRIARATDTPVSAGNKTGTLEGGVSTTEKDNDVPGGDSQSRPVGPDPTPVPLRRSLCPRSAFGQHGQQIGIGGPGRFRTVMSRQAAGSRQREARPRGRGQVRVVTGRFGVSGHGHNGETHLEVS